MPKIEQLVSKKVIILHARTYALLGVLTKPDKLDKNDLTQWISILEGQKFKLGFGYFVVKNNPDANVDHLTARKQEEDFFENEVPFTTKLRSYKDQFGTKKLQAALSQRLTSKIKTRYFCLTVTLLWHITEKADVGYPVFRGLKRRSTIELLWSRRNSLLCPRRLKATSN